ncbi:MAG: GNAT family N-acetyltransferase [Planctomycetota bacterium]|nr:MAG: GNAT family N-acetyltransferase [Planctomycetota bacterium]
MPQIRRLEINHLDALIALRLESLEQAPLAFSASPEDDRGMSPDFMGEVLKAQEGQAVFGAFSGSDLVGMIGLVRESKAKHRHRALIWGMFVKPSHRGSGLGRALLEAVIQHARTWPDLDWLDLSVTSAAPEAQKLYESAGFHRWGAEPDSLRHAGESATKIFMQMELGAGD